MSGEENETNPANERNYGKMVELLGGIFPRVDKKLTLPLPKLQAIILNICVFTSTGLKDSYLLSSG